MLGLVITGSGGLQLLVFHDIGKFNIRVNKSAGIGQKVKTCITNFTITADGISILGTRFFWIFYRSIHSSIPGKTIPYAMVF